MKPVLFNLPGLDWPVQSYGFFVALALVVGWVLSLELARRDRLPADALGTNYVLSVIVGLVAARGAWLLQHPDMFEGWRSLLVLRAGELASMAGVVAALLVAGTLATLRKISALAWYCAAAPAFAVGLALERMGALLAGTAFGTYAPEVPWAIQYPAGSVVYELHVATLGRLLPTGASQSLPVHPTQLYAAVLALVGAAVLLWLRPRRRFTGQLVVGFGIYWIAVRSFIEEPLRHDRAVAVMAGLNAGQLVSIFVVVVLIGIYLALRNGGRRVWKAEPAVRGQK